MIGPPSAFGVQGRDLIVRDRQRGLALLNVFLTRQTGEDLIRPYLKRWGIDTVAAQYADRARLADILARAASSGTLAFAVVPEVTLAFSSSADRLSVRPRQPVAQAQSRPHLPDALHERMILVLGMVPDYLEGETVLAFRQLVQEGPETLAIGLVTWIGAHFIPGVNLAVLAFDFFCLSGSVIRAIDQLVDVIDDIRNAKSVQELRPAAKIVAAVLAVLIAQQVLNRLLKAKSLTKGPGKQSGLLDRKPHPQKKEQRKAPQKFQEEDGPPHNQTASEALDKPSSPLKPYTKAQSDTAKKHGIDPKWVDETGSIKWPANQGFDGPPREEILPVGTKLDRFGNEDGSFLAPDGVPFEQRALPSSSRGQSYKKYEVVKPLPVLSGPATPWFDQPGGGTQYQTKQLKIWQLIEDGYIREVK